MPTRNGTKTAMVLTRLTPQQRAWLERMSDAERRTLSNMLRILIEEGALRRGLVSASSGHNIVVDGQVVEPARRGLVPLAPQGQEAAK